MRRGHAGIGGWRNENSRQFRPRTGGPPLFRHPLRSFGLLETPRFPPPNTRSIRPPPPFKNHPNQATNNPISDHHDRGKYRHDNRQSSQYRSSDRNHHQSQRSLYPMFDRMRRKDSSDQSNQYNNYYDETLHEPNNINSMGDVDHRQPGHMTKTTDPYGRHAISPWSHSVEGQRQFYDDRSKYSKHYKHHDNIESNKFPVVDYTGHRPPASDHYGGNPGSSIDNSHSFSRSVDDTVDIVRKRLQNRNETQPLTDTVDHHDEDLRIPTAIPGDYQNTPQEPAPKKRVQRQKQDRNIESNCDKMKSKIVQQLFKMDKDRIHKLMDNPSSSSKFEYAISSLITESQNSLNKHMRSVAEKSLSSSEDFIHNDNNTIYEDTFMKQMQHILDPQDTVLLEDIKPLVLAELSKVLQLNEYDQPFQVMDNQPSYHQGNEQQNYDSYGETHNYEDYSHSRNSYYDRAISPPPVGYEDYGNSTDLSQLEYDQPEPEKPKPLFERRQARKSKDLIPESREQPAFPSEVNVEPSFSTEEFISFASERRHSRRSIDSKKSEDKNKEPEPPFFDTNAEQLEEDDPFAELDNQYHVAVDHNFIDIDTYDTPSPQQTSFNNSRSSSINMDSNNTMKTPSKEPLNIKKEIDDQLQKMAKSPLKLNLATVEPGHSSINTSNVSVKEEDFSPIKDNMNIQNNSMGENKEHYTESTHVNIHQEKLQNMNTSTKAMMSLSSRKRSIDQKPSHRKEKRKKSEPTQLDSCKAILDKHPVTDINIYGVKNSEKCKEQAKPALSITKTDSTKEVSKDTKAMESADKSYSDKYVKRKETQRKSKDKEDEHKKRSRSLSTSHSMVSPKDCTNNNTQINKNDSKTKLQSIDMFIEQPKKSTSKHQAHRNTALSPNTPTKSIEITKSKQTLLTFNRKTTKKCVSTQVIHKTHVKEIQTMESKLFTNYTTRFCQTEKKRMLTKSVQTIPVSFEKSPSKATDVFERMKEIDLEIQVLLQEKFKLYSSIESNTACPSTIQTLGMTVLNMPLNEVTGNDENQTETLSEDAIVEEFTSIPVEELEQIALESVNEPETPQVQKKTRRHKISEESRASSVSPTVKRSKRKAGKAPNISLLEQIITDDRPIEDIISLDDFETTPVKTKKKSPKQPKKKANKKISSKVGKTLVSIAEYNLIECSVVLQREDLSKFLKPDQEIISIDSSTASPSSVQEVLDKPEDIPLNKPEVQVFNDTNIIEETVVENSISFDMLDVSEDIVVGDICEVKSGDNETERSEVTVNEEIILDNSQAMVEPVQSETAPGNICKMYDYSTDENLRRDAVTVTGHADAVIAIECIENHFVAACLDGNVYYFSGDGQLISTLRGSNLAITCLTIVKEKYGTTIYTGSLDSRIRYYDLETGLEKGPECNVLSPIQTMDRAWDTIFVGTRTGFVLQFECKNNMLIPVSTVKFSDQSILALRAMKEGPRKVLLVAARSENVTIKDAQSGLLLRTLEGPKMTVYTLLYEEGKVYCGTSNHQIHVFDYASGSHAGVHEGGKGAVCLRSSGGLLFAGCYDGCVYIYREGEPRPLAQLRGPSLMLLSLAVVGSKIIAGYKDRSLYIWKIPLIILQEMIL